MYFCFSVSLVVHSFSTAYAAHEYFAALGALENLRNFLPLNARDTVTDLNGHKYEVQVAAWTETMVSAIVSGETPFKAHWLAMVGISTPPGRQGIGKMTSEDPKIVFRREGSVVFHYQDAWIGREITFPRISVYQHIGGWKAQGIEYKRLVVSALQFEGLPVIIDEIRTASETEAWYTIRSTVDTPVNITSENADHKVQIQANERIPFLLNQTLLNSLTDLDSSPRPTFLDGWVGRKVWLRNLPHEYFKIRLDSNNVFDIHQLNNIQVGVYREAYNGFHFVCALRSMRISLLPASHNTSKSSTIFTNVYYELEAGAMLPLVFFSAGEFNTLEEMMPLYRSHERLEAIDSVMPSSGQQSLERARMQVLGAQLFNYHRELIPGILEAFRGAHMTLCLHKGMDLSDSLRKLEYNPSLVIYYGVGEEVIQCITKEALRSDLVFFLYESDLKPILASSYMQALSGEDLSLLKQRSFCLQHAYIDHHTLLVSPAKWGYKSIHVAPIIGDTSLLPVYDADDARPTRDSQERWAISTIGLTRFDAAIELAKVTRPPWKVRWMGWGCSDSQRADAARNGLELLVGLSDSQFDNKLLESSFIFPGELPKPRYHSTRGSGEVIYVDQDYDTQYQSRSSSYRRMTSMIILALNHKIPLILPDRMAQVYNVPKSASIQFKYSIKEVSRQLRAPGSFEYSDLVSNIRKLLKRILRRNRQMVQLMHEVMKQS